MKKKLIKIIGYLFINLIKITNKFEVFGEINLKNAQKKKQPIMLCVWHGRMLFPILYVIKQKIKVWAIASPHNDGDTMAQILKMSGNIQIIEGSSNKKSQNVIDSIHSIYKTDPNAIIAITNDGPKGPIHIAKSTSLEIAKKFDAQIITITGNCTKKWVFNSWDKFYLPKPFGKIVINIAPVFEYKDKQNLVCDVSDYMSFYEDGTLKKIEGIKK